MVKVKKNCLLSVVNLDNRIIIVLDPTIRVMMMQLLLLLLVSLLLPQPAIIS